MLLQFANWCGILAAFFFAASVFLLRLTVLAMLDAGEVTHSIWRGVRQMRWWQRLAFAWRALRTGYLSGTPQPEWSKLLQTPFTQEEVELFSEAGHMGKVPPVYPVQVVAATRTAAYGWLCALFAMFAFISQIIAKALAWLA